MVLTFLCRAVALAQVSALSLSLHHERPGGSAAHPRASVVHCEPLAPLRATWCAPPLVHVVLGSGASLPGLMLRGGGGGGLEDWEESSLSEGPVLETSDADEGDMSGESRRGSGQEEEWEEELREEDEDLRKVLRKQRTKAVRDGEMFWSQPVPQGLEMEEVSVLVYACADGHL